MYVYIVFLTQDTYQLKKAVDIHYQNFSSPAIKHNMFKQERALG